MKELDPARAAIIAEAGRHARRNVATAKTAIKELKGKTRLNPATLINSLFLRVALVGCWVDAKSDERSAKKTLDLFKAHHESPRVDQFYTDVKERANSHGMVGSSMAIDYIHSLDATSLYELRYGKDWATQPESVKVILEIALAIAQADIGKKRGRVFTLDRSEGSGVENPLFSALDGLDIEKVRDETNNQTAVMKKVYKMLGLEDKIKDIPAIPAHNMDYPLVKSRFHHLDEYGVSILFNFTGSWDSKASFLDGPASFSPAYIGVTVRAERDLVK